MIRSLPLVLLLGTAAAAEQIQPAELPPADFAGLQYVDSKGCMFVRAGNATGVVWIPRVSRQGVPDCDNPPSGRRVPVVEEVGVQPITPAVSPAAPKAASDAVTGAYLIAVGSFGVSENADRAEAQLTDLNLRTIRGQVQGGSGPLITVFAGPFPDEASARAAQDVLRDAGIADTILVGP